MKLWDKGIKKDHDLSKIVEDFTVGKDRDFDKTLALYDIQGNLAHAEMLSKVGLLTKKEGEKIKERLLEMLEEAKKGTFIIEDGIEDIHSQIEYNLTKSLGEIGKKIHSARSRNDQVLVDLKLYLRAEIKKIAELISLLFYSLQEQSERHKNQLLPGYTHLQVAMPSSFGLWFGAYAESLTDDLEMLLAAYKIINKNPLGSAAGYGSSFPIDREFTTKKLKFDTLNYNVVYAQMTRGKSEKIMASAMASVAGTLNKLACDICLYSSQNFGFIEFPNALTTGSSIMPHKKNPDVFELIRAKTNNITALPHQLALLISNLPSGYHRDFQLTKETLFPEIENLKRCLKMTNFMLKYIKISNHLLDDEKYKYCFSVEAVNKEVLQGTSFRDAYKKVGNAIETSRFNPEKTLRHTHIGSLGNLANPQIKANFEKVWAGFNFVESDPEWE